MTPGCAGLKPSSQLGTSNDPPATGGIRSVVLFSVRPLSADLTHLVKANATPPHPHLVRTGSRPSANLPAPCSQKQSSRRCHLFWSAASCASNTLRARFAGRFVSNARFFSAAHDPHRPLRGATNGSGRPRHTAARSAPPAWDEVVCNQRAVPCRAARPSIRITQTEMIAI